jgi:hypothetical protein
MIAELYLSGEIVFSEEEFWHEIRWGKKRRSSWGRKHRGQIKGMSAASGKRLRRAIENSVPGLRVFATVTYPDCPTPEEAKADLERFCRSLDSIGVAYIWFMEFQRRGSIHFHFLLGDYLPWKRLVAMWQSATHGRADARAATHIKYLNRGMEESAKYAAKYARKSARSTNGLLKGIWTGRCWGRNALARKLETQPKTFELPMTYDEVLKRCKKVLKTGVFECWRSICGRFKGGFYAIKDWANIKIEYVCEGAFGV